MSNKSANAFLVDYDVNMEMKEYDLAKEYKDLSKKCDDVLELIKKRKQKK